MVLDYSILWSIQEAIDTIRDHDTLLRTVLRLFYTSMNLEVGGVLLYEENHTDLRIYVAHKQEDSFVPEQDLWNVKISAEELPFLLPEGAVEITRLTGEKILERAPNSRFRGRERTIEEDIRTYDFYLVPLITMGTVLGYLIIRVPKEYNLTENFDLLKKAANRIAAVLKNMYYFEELQLRERMKESLLNMTNQLLLAKTQDELICYISAEMDRIVKFDFIGSSAVDLPDIEELHLTYIKKGTDSNFVKTTYQKGQLPIELLQQYRIKYGYAESIHFSGARLDEICQESSYFKHYRDKHKIKVFIYMPQIMPLLPHNQQAHVLIGCRDREEFTQTETQALKYMAPQTALIVKNFMDGQRVKELTLQLQREKSLLVDEISGSTGIEEITGNSLAIQNVTNKINIVAPLDATVLILGETGTGKELIARAIHNLSNRKSNSLIKINCAALPAQLIESELFGHEKGSFTGAIETKIGKFELANNGTVFLDEIGELPLEAQSKLLRVLQEKEFERIGGRKTIKSNVRVVAATNRNLEKEVAEGKFRADLYYRLNVFPIISPPLRERKEDIPVLTKKFIEEYSKRVGKVVTNIKKTDLDKLMNYNWPGNVRELEHFIERAVIISPDTTLTVDHIDSLVDTNAPVAKGKFVSLAEMEKSYIIKALQAAAGKVTGEGSAAELLKLNGKTLASKMRKFGIKREVTIRG